MMLMDQNHINKCHEAARNFSDFGVSVIHRTRFRLTPIKSGVRSAQNNTLSSIHVSYPVSGGIDNLCLVIWLSNHITH